MAVQLQQYEILDFTSTTPLTAADISNTHGLDTQYPLVILDNDFRGLPQTILLS